jgi:hypothetical protein
VFKQFQLHESLNFEIRGEFFNLFNFEVAADQTASLDYIHRRSAGADIYFIRNTQPNSLQTMVTLRVSGRQPKVFDAITGEIHQTLLFTPTADHRTSVSLALEAVRLRFRSVSPPGGEE